MSALEPSPGLLSAGQAVAVALHAIAQAGLAVYAVHRWPMLVHRPGPAPARAGWWRPGAEPRVLVQLPVRDEPAVVERLVAAVAALDWPAERLDIQLLDDSGDVCAALGAAAVARVRACGIRAVQIRRAHASGFKAGALAAGLARSDAEFVVVFDADFVPARDFLVRMLPHFAAADVGMAQARWGHLNRDASLLTRAQAVLLDAHQLLEHSWRQRTGRFFNFNGTAGMWRRMCIESAGGWQHDTLTEDLDLSYRAQLAGWRFVFDADVVVPAELPADMAALRTQQRRWARGALQTARKLLPVVWRTPLPWRVRLEASLHLTGNVNYALLLLLSLALVPMLVAGAGGPPPAIALGLTAAGTVPVIAFLVAGARRAGAGAGRVALDVAAALVLCAGLSWHLSRAAVDGLFGPTGTFVRTPKTGATGRAAADRTTPPAPQVAGAGLVELALAATFLAAAATAGLQGNAGAVAVFGVLATGLTWVGAGVRAPRFAKSGPARAG